MASTCLRVLNRVLLTVNSVAKSLSLLGNCEHVIRSSTDHQFFFYTPHYCTYNVSKSLVFPVGKSLFFSFSSNRTERQYGLKGIRGRVLLVYYSFLAAFLPRNLFFFLGLNFSSKSYINFIHRAKGFCRCLIMLRGELCHQQQHKSKKPRKRSKSYAMNTCGQLATLRSLNGSSVGLSTINGFWLILGVSDGSQGTYKKDSL